LLVLSGIASAFAASWRARIDRGPWSVLRFLIPGGLMLLLAGAVATGFRGVPILSQVFSSGFSFEVRLGAALLALAFFNSVINQARSRERAQGIALRKRLASVRRYFQEELEKPQPALRDEWFPYVLAFGLDKDARDWFKAHGGKSTSDRETSWSSSPSSSSSSGGWLVEQRPNRLERRRRLVRRRRRHRGLGGGSQRSRGRRGGSFVVRELGRRRWWGRRRKQQRWRRRRRLVM
jgi:hypothetical protein